KFIKPSNANTARLACDSEASSWPIATREMRSLLCRFRREQREADSFSLFIQRIDPARDHVADLHEVEWGGHEVGGHFADVDQGIVLQADIHEGAEVDDVGDHPMKLHAGFQVVKGENSRAEHRTGD